MRERSVGGGTRCPRCGTPAPPGTLFCDRCGTALSEAAKSPFRIFPYDENHAKINRAYESKKSRWLRGIVYLGVPLAVSVADTGGTWLDAAWMPWVLLLLGMLAFAVSWRRRDPFMAARRSACVFDPRTKRNYYVTLAEEAMPGTDGEVEDVIRRKLDGLSDLLLRGTLFERGNPVYVDGMRIWSDEAAEAIAKRRSRTRYRYPAATNTTSKRTGKADIPHAFPGSPLTEA